MTVSVIIPCFNSARYIGKAIESALNQSHDGCEIIVVDDGSTDESAHIISKFEDAITVIRQENAGACAARNAGLARASGDYVKFLDADDWLHPECLSKQLDAAESSNEVHFGYARVVTDENYDNDSEDPILQRGHLQKDTLNAGEIARLRHFFKYPILTSLTLHPRKVLQQAGGFDPTVKRGQEHELHLRLYLSGVNFRFAPVLCYYYRQHSGESRISNTHRYDHYFSDIGRFSELVETARSGAREADFDCDRQHFARKAWSLARRQVQMGETQRPSEFFALARDLAGYEAIYGRSAYRALVRAFDPVFVERMLMKGRRIFRPSRAK